MHWRLLSEWPLGVTRSVVDALDAQLDALDAGFDPTTDDSDFFLEEVEHALGLGLVAIQRYLRATRETIREVQESRALVAPSMSHVLQHFGEMVANTSDLREMHAVWHLANFWKHQDEWNDDWAQEAAASRQSAVTINGLGQLGIERVGLERRTEYPCVHGVGRLTEIERLGPLLERAVAWREACVAAYVGPSASG